MIRYQVILLFTLSDQTKKKNRRQTLYLRPEGNRGKAHEPFCFSHLSVNLGMEIRQSITDVRQEEVLIREHQSRYD